MDYLAQLVRGLDILHFRCGDIVQEFKELGKALVVLQFLVTFQAAGKCLVDDFSRVGVDGLGHLRRRGSGFGCEQVPIALDHGAGLLRNSLDQMEMAIFTTPVALRAPVVLRLLCVNALVEEVRHVFVAATTDVAHGRKAGRYGRMVPVASRTGGRPGITLFEQE